MLFTEEEKQLIATKLANLLTKDGLLQVRSQVHRTQLENKATATKKLQELGVQAFKKKKARIASKPGKAAKQKRLDLKKRNSQKKQNRRQGSWEN